MLESYVWNSVASRHDMDSMAEHYLGLRTIHFEDVAGKGAKQLTFNQVPVDKASEYSAEDADVTLRLHRTLWPQIERVPALAGIARAYETISDWPRFEHWLNTLRGAELVTFDTETTSLDYMQAEIVGVSFCVEPGIAAYVPLRHDYPGAPDQLDRERVLAALKPLLEDAALAKLGANLKYDMHVLENHGI